MSGLQVEVWLSDEWPTKENVLGKVKAHCHHWMVEEGTAHILLIMEDQDKPEMIDRVGSG